MVQIYEIENKRDLELFIKLPWKIYQNNAYWVPPLINDQKKTA